jgi:hypothetical protein
MNYSSIDIANKQGCAFAFRAALLFPGKPIIIKSAYGFGISALSLLLLCMTLALPVYLLIGTTGTIVQMMTSMMAVVLFSEIFTI